MKVTAITMLIWLGLATVAAGQGTASSKAPSSGPASKAQLSEIRSLVHELELRTDKLRDLMAQYRSLVERRPQPEGASPEAKKAHDDQLAKWSASLERLLAKLDGGRAAVVETVQQLNQAVTGQLPTGLAKDVANARNDADAQRAAAEEALVKSKPAAARASKRAAQKPAAEPAAPPPELPDDL